MARKSETFKKKVYRLFWEYLKRSPGYKEWCLKSRERQKGFTFGDQWIKAHSGKRVNPFYAIYTQFGDIFNRSFDKWFADFASKTRKRIAPFYDFIDSESAAAIDDFRFTNQKDPSLGEFVEKLKERFKLNPWHLIIFLERGQDIETLIKEITEMIKKEIRKRRSALIPILTIGPRKQLRLEEVERYLRIYDLREKKVPYREISKRIYPKKDFSGEVRSSLITQKKKAERIIRNVEKGFFPGKYSSSFS
jgi:hypothetical protein